MYECKKVAYHPILTHFSIVQCYIDNGFIFEWGENHWWNIFFTGRNIGLNLGHYSTPSAVGLRDAETVGQPDKSIRMRFLLWKKILEMHFFTNCFRVLIMKDYVFVLFCFYCSLTIGFFIWIYFTFYGRKTQKNCLVHKQFSKLLIIFILIMNQVPIDNWTTIFSKLPILQSYWQFLIYKR